MDSLNLFFIRRDREHEIYECLREYIEEAFAKTDKAHDFLHSLRVYENAVNILSDHPEANADIVKMAFQYESEIRQVISEVSFSKKIKATTIEAKIVQDADRLDAIGAIGIARVFTYGGATKRPIYSSDQPSSLSHFESKLFKIKDLMNT